MDKESKLAAFFKSLRFRVIALLLAVTIIPGILLYMGVINSYESRAVSLREGEVLGHAKILANQISTRDPLKENLYIGDDLQAEITLLGTIYNGRTVLINRYYRIIYDSYHLDEGKTIISEEVIRSFGGTPTTYYDSANSYIEMTIPVIHPEDSSKTVNGVLMMSVATDNVASTKAYLANIAIVIEIILFAVTVFFGILVTLWVMKPLKQLADEAHDLEMGIGKGELTVSTATETRRISKSINSVLRKMRIMDESRQQFVSNVSHELKTPMTSMKVLADTINSMPDAPLEMYQEFMGDIASEIDRENKIISDLLSLVKMDKADAALNISPVNVNALLEQILKRLQPIADKQQVSLVLESFRPIVAEIDEVKMTLAITNLIENGIKYNKDDGTGWVHVTLNADHQYFYIKVEDSGMGIPEEALDHIYERFYRVDKSHSREIGGTGLGLAITRGAIRQHRGQIKVHSILGEGTTFDVRIPLTYITRDQKEVH